MSDGPKNSYRAQLWAEKLAKATRVRVHPTREQEIRTMIEGVEMLAHLAKPGGIIVDEHLEPAQVILENHLIEPEV